MSYEYIRFRSYNKDSRTRDILVDDGTWTPTEMTRLPSITAELMYDTTRDAILTCARKPRQVS